ncbi:MAG TPA: antibiotic biosynthesis monooxygenase [Candidatus Acidoferrales bacterium]
MIQILWEYEVKPGKEVAFETHYTSLGTWSQLFQKAHGYRGTVLLRDAKRPARYVSVDIWSDREAYDTFRREFADEYEKIDALCAGLTDSEREIGIFEVQ